MPYEIFLPEFFKKVVADLKKKYPSVADDLDDLKVALRVIAVNPELGRSLRGYGHIKKLRVRNSDLRKGKRGGYRLIYSVDTSAKMIAPLLLYTKSQKPDISKKELSALIASLEREVSE